jgi:hypothetical protein
MILPWHTDLFQPGRTVCVVFRASPLIWPTSSGAHHAPRPLTKVHPRWFSARGYRCLSRDHLHSSRVKSAIQIAL